MKRPLRSVWLGNPRYLSVYGLGVQQAMGMLGHWHRAVSIWDSPDDISRQMSEMCPDMIWTHSVAWPPPNAASASDLCSIVERWRRQGAITFMHDGDPRQRTVENPDLDVAATFSAALVNRAVESCTWPMPMLRWPYAAMVQREISEARDEWRCDLLFAGHLRRTQEGYGDRTKLVYDLQRTLGPRMRIVRPGGGDANNRMLAADVAPSANAVLGYGRPDVLGWVDTRVFQYPGAGGVLIHNDGADILEENKHYLRFDTQDAVSSVLQCVERAKKDGPGIRERAFKYIQANHTWLHRVQDALAFVGLG